VDLVSYHSLKSVGFLLHGTLKMCLSEKYCAFSVSSPHLLTRIFPLRPLHTSQIKKQITKGVTEIADLINILIDLATSMIRLT